MKVAIGSDHAGFKLKDELLRQLRSSGHQVSDLGTQGEESVDYPDFAARVAQEVASGRVERGVLVCGTGIGMSISANKIAGVRAALCHNSQTAEMSRRHNDANVLCLGSRVVSSDEAREILATWVATAFDGGRHDRRVAKIGELERGGAGQG